jgi:hypothetical protein
LVRESRYEIEKLHTCKCADLYSNS